MSIDPDSDAWARTTKFALMFRDAANALVEADPGGVVVDGDWPDEYDDEAAQIVRLVLDGAESRDDVLSIVEGVLAHNFGQSQLVRSSAIADTIWRRFLDVRQDT